MTRWVWKRWVWAVLAGTAVTTGAGLLAADQPAAPGALPKANDTITLLEADGKTERKLTVVKATRKPDGSIETEVKDPKTGETMTFTESPPEKSAAPAGSKAPATAAKPPATTPAAKPTGITVPPVQVKADTAPAARQPETPPARNPILPRPKFMTDEPPQAPAPDTNKGRFFGRLFGRDQADPAPAPTAGTTNPDEGKRPSLINRIFGTKRPASSSAPTPSGSASTPAPVSAPPAVMQPPPRSVPVTGPTGEPPRSAAPSRPITPPPAPGRPEPVNPPAPVVATPPPLPAPGAGSIPVPTPLPPPGSVPVPLPTIPAPLPPPGGGL